MPALFTSTSSPPNASTAAATMRSMSSRFETSQTTVFRPEISFAAVSSAFALMSQTQTLAPISAKALAISFPMPDAPAVTNTRCAIIISDIAERHHDVRFVPKADIGEDYSITSSASSNTGCGMVKLSALAVFRLITNSNLVGCSTGSSAGFSPLTTRPVYTPVS